jgi:hypothetical protein
MEIDSVIRGDAAARQVLPGTAETFRILRQGRCIEVQHESGAIFAFLLNSARTGLIECRRPSDRPEHEVYRDAARRFCERVAHEAGLIFQPKAA